MADDHDLDALRAKHLENLRKVRDGGIWITVDPIITFDRTPPLTGRVSSPNALVKVYVYDEVYEAINNGDGTWIVPDDAVDPFRICGVFSIRATAEDGPRFAEDTTDKEVRIVDQDVTLPINTGVTAYEFTPPQRGLYEIWSKGVDPSDFTIGTLKGVEPASTAQSMDWAYATVVELDATPSPLVFSSGGLPEVLRFIRIGPVPDDMLPPEDPPVVVPDPSDTGGSVGNPDEIVPYLGEDNDGVGNNVVSVEVGTGLNTWVRDPLAKVQGLATLTWDPADGPMPLPWEYIGYLVDDAGNPVTGPTDGDVHQEWYASDAGRNKGLLSLQVHPSIRLAGRYEIWVKVPAHFKAMPDTMPVTVYGMEGRWNASYVASTPGWVLLTIPGLGNKMRMEPGQLLRFTVSNKGTIAADGDDPELNPQACFEDVRFRYIGSPIPLAGGRPRVDNYRVQERFVYNRDGNVPLWGNADLSWWSAGEYHKAGNLVSLGGVDNTGKLRGCMWTTAVHYKATWIRVYAENDMSRAMWIGAKASKVIYGDLIIYEGTTQIPEEFGVRPSRIVPLDLMFSGLRVLVAARWGRFGTQQLTGYTGQYVYWSTQNEPDNPNEIVPIAGDSSRPSAVLLERSTGPIDPNWVSTLTEEELDALILEACALESHHYASGGPNLAYFFDQMNSWAGGLLQQYE